MGQLLQFAPPVILAAIVEARLKFEDLINQLLSTTPSTASGIETLVSEQGREVLRLLMQGALDVKAAQEQPKAVVVGPDQVPRRHVRPRKRSLETSLGRVTVSRLGYSGRQVDSHMPLDAELALPRDLYSYRVRRVVAEAACIVSYTNARAFAEQAGCTVPPRQAEELVSRAAADFDAFYASRPVSPSTPTDLLVLSCDGKGIVMRKEALRASAREPKSRLDKRRSKGERAQRRRMAEVVAVYDLVAEPRAVDDVMAGLNGKPRLVTDRARPTNKRTWASVEREYVEVIEEAFAEALRRDPQRKRRWVVLVDGNLGQLKEIQRCAKEHQVELTIIVDVIHVIEYLWRAGVSFHGEGTKPLEEWVTNQFEKVLKGKAKTVASSMRRQATIKKLKGHALKNVEVSARYLTNYEPFLRYDSALVAGLPIASGVIEGACRSLVRDRMDITGARWSLAGAEAVLRLRSLKASGDFDAYWEFHVEQDQKRTHP